MSAILGVSCYFHDAAAALLRDGDLVAAAEEERFSRRKHDSGFPAHAIDFCLEQGGLARGELDYVVFYEKPLVKLQRIAATVLATAPRGQAPFARTLEAWTGERVWIRRRLAERLGVARDRVLFVDHHLAHAASAFLASPFDEAALLTVDGVGEWTTAAIGRGAPGSVTLEREIRFPHSLGLFYTAFTAFLGFEVNEGEYKVMGMAPYGEPRLVEEVRRTIDLHGDGSFSLDLDYFAFQHSLARPYSSRFEELFGVPARDPRDDFVTAATHPGASRADVERSRVYADIAASAQAVLEDTVVGLANEAHRRTGLDTLCLAGGVALNGVANRRLLERTPFTGLFIPPAPGDSGGALGAALYADHVLLGRTRRFVMEHAYWGRAYAREEIDAALAAHGAAYERLDEEELCAHVSDELAAGRVVGWFQGR
ncbi:MAG: carbamoyltransferase, partial [Gaiellaceae bacterium]|nr:carbamoyltransferase [Gaiellaceae bacterium]